MFVWCGWFSVCSLAMPHFISFAVCGWEYATVTVSDVFQSCVAAPNVDILIFLALSTFIYYAWIRNWGSGKLLCKDANAAHSQRSSPSGNGMQTLVVAGSHSICICVLSNWEQGCRRGACMIWKSPEAITMKVLLAMPKTWHCKTMCLYNIKTHLLEVRIVYSK